MHMISRKVNASDLTEPVQERKLYHLSPIDDNDPTENQA